jgi:hypothetical protein
VYVATTSLYGWSEFWLNHGLGLQCHLQIETQTDTITSTSELSNGSANPYTDS